MKKAEVLKALNTAGSRVFARIIWGSANGKVLVKGVEQTKKEVLEALKNMDDDAELGVNVSKSGHVYINGLSCSEALELGEPVSPEGAAAAQ